MKEPDPFKHYRRQVEADREKARRQKPAPPPEDPGDPANPWSKVGWSITAQMRLTQNNPAEAQRLCELTGKKWTPPQMYYDRK